MKAVFADSFYFFALLNEHDASHASAAEFTSQFRGRILTTGWIITELGDGMARSSSRGIFVQLYRESLAKPDLVIVPCTEELLSAGINFYAARADKDWSLTDCISFVVMQREGITEALTADHHFEQAGFVPLLRS
jgi:predicted nucleic acid-binding protein